MFDPFRDFEKNGYLRNIRKDKDEDVVKRFEHNLFRAHLAEALNFLASLRVISYKDFLQVHQILFSSYYPWAGQDRSVTMPDRAVTKGDVMFCHPFDSKRAVEAGLALGQKKSEMSKRPGEVMGLFAYGHPFLDGNGRTILLVHLELSYRAGFSISWADTKKSDYLKALSQEINTPGKGLLDSYLTQFKTSRAERSEWGKSLFSMRGLDGLDDGNQIGGDLSDPMVVKKYREFENRRNYTYQVSSEICENCSATPCVCEEKARPGTSREIG